MIVDAHLDIAWNAISAGRGFLAEPAPGYLVSRSSLARAGVGLVCATLYCAPARARRSMRTRFVYGTPHEANLMATAQVNYYRSCGLPLLRTSSEVREYARTWRRGRLAAILLMEGADPVELPSHVSGWAEAGVRIIGPAWGRTRYAGGTRAPGGLTELGFRLLRAMRSHRLILDLSHLAEQSVADAFEVWRGPIMCSHSNARALCPGDRQISEQTAAEVGRRGGMLGVSFYKGHLRPDGERSRAGLEDVVDHLLHLARAAGGPEQVGLGTDLDGGFDARYAAVSDLGQLSELRRRLRKRFSAAQVEGVMGGNWLDFFSRSLP